MRAPFAEGVPPWAAFGAAGEPWAWVCVVCAGGFCDENLELILEIHELRRELGLKSGGVVPPFFASLPRLSIVGRLGGIFWGADGVLFTGAGAGAGAGTGGETGLCAADSFAGSGTAAPPWLDGGPVGRPPWDDVLGGASLVRPGDEGACVRWWCWWSAVSQALVGLVLCVPLEPREWSRAA